MSPLHENNFLGTKLWTFVNNSCHNSKMNLHSCGDEMFPCTNGECVPLAGRCNTEKDCNDESDEQNCNLVTMAQGYNRKIPALTRREKTGGNSSKASKSTVEVSVEVYVFQISRLDEMTGTLNLGLTIDTFWYDSRLTFNFLKNDTNMNHIPTLPCWNPSSTEFIVWTPTLLFRNTDGALATTRNRGGKRRKCFPRYFHSQAEWQKLRKQQAANFSPPVSKYALFSCPQSTLKVTST